MSTAIFTQVFSETTDLLKKTVGWGTGVVNVTLSFATDAIQNNLKGLIVLLVVLILVYFFVIRKEFATNQSPKVAHRP